MRIERTLSSSEQEEPAPLDAMRRHLAELAALIGRVEASVAQGTYGSLTRAIAVHEAATYRIMEAIGTLLHDVGASGEPPEVVAQVRETASDQLAAWSNTSPVFFHVRNTPRADFNNFEIALLLLENRVAGGTAAAQILDRYYLGMDASRSFQKRFPKFADRLADETRRRAAEDGHVQILNLHTNTGRELELLATKRAFVEAVQITCLDRDPMALRRARQRLERYARHSRFVLADARKYTASRTWSEAPYDIIYTVNLFDQLDDEQTVKLIADCQRGLAPGGVLMFGNYAPSMSIAERALIRWPMNWEIRVRPVEEWRRIFAQAWHDPECVRFELDELRTSQLVIATRR